MKNIGKFFDYARERHKIYLEREAGKPRPWTKDKILNTYKFTNVFRELDRTTQWYAEHVREKVEVKDVLLATVVFRMFNRIDTGEAIFWQTTLERGKIETAFDLFRDDGDVRHLRRAIKAHCGSGPYVTGAYIISSPPGYSKLDGVLEVLNRFYRQPQPTEIVPRLVTAGHTNVVSELLESPGKVSLEDVWEWLRMSDYFGSFHSYEIVTDLRHTELLDRAPDIMTWANPGPGARRGANRVHGYPKNDRRMNRDQLIQTMQDILQESRKAEYWPQGGKATRDLAKNDLDWPKWEMRDVEHTLCEFDKYERVRKGEGRPRGVYR